MRGHIPTRPAARTHSLALESTNCGSMEQQNLATGWVMNGVMMAEDVRAEIVASVLEVVVNEGDQIGEGDTLVLLESMKMEIPVLAEVAGTVSKVSVSVGDVIQAGDLIAVIS
jgi:acetyl-CoA carboxylase biotin carboxyl carrier protein